MNRKPTFHAMHGGRTVDGAGRPAEHPDGPLTINSGLLGNRGPAGHRDGPLPAPRRLLRTQAAASAPDAPDSPLPVTCGILAPAVQR